MSFDSTQQEGNIKKGKLKSQKELKKITDSKEYKDSDYNKKTEMLNRATHKKGGSAKNTRRMNRLEELGRVDAEKAYTKKGKRNLKDEKKRIVKELKKVPSGKKGKGIRKLPRKVRNKMGYMKSGGRAGFSSGGAALRGMGCEIK
tara:strand:- start:216 stop:650 length:435 start_codon:yes stop_codon:yes gene_type:complete